MKLHIPNLFNISAKNICGSGSYPLKWAHYWLGLSVKAFTMRAELLQV